MRRGRPERVGEVLKEVLARPEIKRGLLAGRVLALWPEVAGKELARLTRAEGFKRGVLFVRTRDHVLAHQLAYQRPAILARYAERLGPGVVREVRFKSGPLFAPPPSAKEEEREAKAPPPLDPEAEAWLLETIRPLPERLKRPALLAGRAVLARLATSPRCPVCGGPAEEEGRPCAGCQVRLDLPAVVAEARRLELGHPPRLEGELALAARWRAAGELEKALRALAREALSDEERLPELLELALRYLRLRTGREPGLRDLDLLPEGVRSLLATRLGGRA